MDAGHEDMHVGSTSIRQDHGQLAPSPARTLAATAAAAKKALGDSATGPLRAAYLIVEIVDAWPRYKAESGDLSPDAWLAKTFGRGKGVEWFSRRHRAAERLDFRKDKTPLRVWHHEAAVWAFDQIKRDEDLQALQRAVILQTRENGGNPLTEAQVVLLAGKVLGWTRRKRAVKACERCDRMAAALLAAGLPVPE